MTERQQLEQAIVAQESLRGVVDDAIVDAAVAALREKLAELDAADHPELQRKQVTVLFMDTVDSTQMIRSLDPEENLAIMEPALMRLAGRVEEYGGHIARFMGDGFKAVFGHPQVQESDPDKAVRAGLAILESTKAYAAEVEAGWGIPGFDVRVGISTGSVVIGGPSEGQDSITGQAVNLASRLEKMAAPGTMLISHATYAHVRGTFELQSLPPVDVKGFAEPMAVYRVLAAKERVFRTRKRGLEGIDVRMIGREQQIRQLQESFWEVTKEKSRQIITIIGEAGIGKSRLMDEFEQWVDEQPLPVRIFQGRARAENQGLPYGLWRDLFASCFNIQDGDTAAIARQKFVQGFAERPVLADGQGGGKPGEKNPESSEAAMRADFAGYLLGYDFRDSPYLALVMDNPQQIRDRALIYLVDYFKAVSKGEPVLILLEDLHWADDSSLDALARLALEIHGHPLLFLCATRETLLERRPDWGEAQSYHSHLTLRPLSEPDSRLLLAEVLKMLNDLPAELQDLVIGRAGGNPYFVEEIVKMLMDEGAIVKGQPHWEVMPDKLAGVQVPTTLAGVLQARLESLPENEYLAMQQASVIGRIFWDAAILYLNGPGKASLAKPVIDQGLASMQQRELIYHRDQSDFAGAKEYIFKHALLRDVAYESVLIKVRRLYHALIAEWIETQSGERVREVTNLLAEHLARAGNDVQAIRCLQQAGQEALDKYANEEAVVSFSRALDLAAEDDLPLRYELYAGRVEALHLLGKRVMQAADLRAMETLADQMGDSEKQVQVALQWANYHRLTGNFQDTIISARRAIQIAAGDKALEAHGYLQWGRVLWRQGAYPEAEARLREALTLARETGQRRLEASSLLNLGNVVGDHEDIAAGQIYYQQALEISRELGARVQEAYVVNNLGISAALMGDFATARDYFERALAIAQETGNRQGEGLASGNLGNVSVDLGDFSASQAYFQQYLEIATLMGNRQGMGHALSGLGDAAFELGNLAVAADYYLEADQLRVSIGQEHLAMESRAGRIRALMAQGDTADCYGLVESILQFMDRSDALAASEDLRIYLTCVQVLRANDDPRASALLETAHEKLQEQAANIDDPAQRRSFLENIPWHREIVAIWTAQQDKEP